MTIRNAAFLASAAILAASTPAAAQDAGPETGPAGPPLPSETVFDGDFLSIGVGAGFGPSYTGSDDYVVFPLPIVQASYKGIDINPRPAGLAIDFIPDADEGVSFDLGVAGRLRSDRADQIEDETVELYGELDRAVEVGPTAGISVPGVLNRFDSVTVSVDALFDVAGAHGGMTVSPSVSYFTPLSRGVAASIGASATFVDDDYADYYFSVPQAATIGPDPRLLPAFDAEGGLQSIGVNALVAVDLNGDITDGGLSLVAIGGYSRLMGDAKDTPFTSVVGSADQFLVGAGIGYTF
ncbi:MipA/OmpV family protein [Altererythrobacter sp. MTPC7]|uniref:MipA/OmpV family protein n=1 Tax=Altererythrobacter sp. MTPC7 TaxID=3056567 RepID=UPI0036F41941